MSSFPGGTEVGPGGNGDLNTGGVSDPGGGLDVLDTIESNQNDNKFIHHGLNRLLLALLLRIFPQTDIKTELADHGLKAEPNTPEAILESPELRRLAVRPSNFPFAQDNPDPRNLNPRSSLRVSR